MKTGNIRIPNDALVEFCRKWKVTELALFGSVLREDFQPDSDVDLLITFAPETHWSIIDHFGMENELVDLLGREVDLVTRQAVQENPNWIRRKEILDTARIIYAA